MDATGHITLEVVPCRRQAPTAAVADRVAQDGTQWPRLLTMTAWPRLAYFTTLPVQSKHGVPIKG